MNWIETIALLKEAGYTQPQIAAFCNCAQSTISDLSNGHIKEPRDSLGQSLRALANKARRKLAAQKASTQ